MTNSFNDFVKLTEYVNKFNGIAFSESWHSDIAKIMPNIDLDLPKVQKKARIDVILDKKNPIYVQLSDGTKLFFTYDEFRRIEGKPRLGKNMTVIMQRLGQDTSDFPSQIVKCMVAD